MTGQSLELFYVDGRPDGIVTAEMFNWTGSVLLAPRTELSRLIESHEQARHSGIYLLTGDDSDGAPLAYIGPAEDIAVRIRNHDVNKDWWTQVAIVTAAENRLNRAHISYLESRLIERAHDIVRVPLANGTRPSLPSLSAADISKMEAFLGYLLIVFPALRVDMFVERKRQAIPVLKEAASEADPSPPEPLATFVLENSRQGLSAKATLVDGEFIVLAGSQAKKEFSEASTWHSYYDLHTELRRSNVLVENGDLLEFGENYVFASVSAAASVVQARSANGQLDWHEIESGLTYKEWESRRLAAIADTN